VSGPGFSNHLTASATGGIAVNSVTFTSPTQISININTTGVPWGTYTITITNPDGQITTIPITIGSPLPIELLSFTAHPVEKGCGLEWVTASETNNDYFTLERSHDGINFEEAVTVKGAGNSTQTITYRYTDEHAFSGVSYYRLKQTDYDGHFEYSELVPFQSGKHNFELANIVADAKEQSLRIYINTDREEIITYQLNDANGKLIYNGSHAAIKGMSLLQLDGSILNSGIYYITVRNNQNAITRKIYF
jgi:hypothetical protein